MIAQNDDSFTASPSLLAEHASEANGAGGLTLRRSAHLAALVAHHCAYCPIADIGFVRGTVVKRFITGVAAVMRIVKVGFDYFFVIVPRGT